MIPTELIDALVVAGIYHRDHDSDAKLAIEDLIAWHAAVAVDVRVSAPAAQIRLDTLKECREMMYENHVIVALPMVDALIDEMTNPPALEGIS